jgi:8-oxo-dGTP diphosphatase
MEKYTVGIVFNKELSKVILVLKNRPKWQEGLYNFPGGHIEKGESGLECIIREVKEECEIRIISPAYIGKIVNNMANYYVKIYTTITEEVHLHTNEDQIPIWAEVENLPKNIVSNLLWLIPFAKNYIQIGNNPDYISFGKFKYNAILFT